MKRTLIILLVIILCFSTAHGSADGEKLQIVVTNFPCYDIVMAVTGDNALVQMLLHPGSESHNYEPTPQDIITIQTADLFVYVGGESDSWVKGILESMDDSAPATLTLFECVELLQEETTVSMSFADEDEQMEEHVWTSPVNVMKIANAVTSILSSMFPDEDEIFKANNAIYQEKLKQLDAAIRETVAQGSRKTVIFGDRFPFRYFVHEYGLQYDAAFPGCSQESEPSVRTVISLIDKIRDEQIPVVFYIEYSSCRTADILSEETGAKTMLFHSCHNVSQEEIDRGTGYLELMWNNVQALKEALH